MNPTISLSMIVKNEGKHLTGCLNSVKNFVDEIIIVDTGSIDNTIQIAESFVAKIFHFEWTNDFSEARNFALSKSNCDWILYLDADERLDNDSALKLKQYANQSGNIGYYCTIKSYDSHAQRNDTIRYVRFFKNHPQARFTGKVHEQITPSLEKLNYKFVHSDILIHHIGYDISKEDKKKKATRNLKLLEKEYAVEKSDYVLFQIAQSNFILENFDNAKQIFLQLIKSKRLNKQFKAESYSYLSQICFNNFQNKEAEQFINDAIRLNNSQTFYHLLRSKIVLRNGNIAEAKKELLKAFELTLNSEKLQFDNLQQVHISPEEILYYGLQLAYQTNDENLKQKMFNELSKRKENNFVELIRLLDSNSGAAFEKISDFLQSINELNLSLLTYIISKHQNKSLMFALLKELFKKFPDNSDVIKQYGLFLDHFNNTEEAIKLFKSKFEIIKSDPSALLYLAMFNLKSNLIEDALNLLNEIEKEFKTWNDILIRVRTIKDKLQSSVRV